MGLTVSPTASVWKTPEAKRLLPTAVLRQGDAAAGQHHVPEPSDVARLDEGGRVAGQGRQPRGQEEDPGPIPFNQSST